MPHDPGMTASVFGAASALLALTAMTRVACIDLQCFMIDLDWTELAGWAGLAAIIAVESPDALPGAVATAAAAGGTTWLVARLRPGRVGQGDVWLFAVLGLVAGPDHAPFVMALVIAFALAAHVAYGLARGRGPLGSGIPAALPAMAALGPAFTWRVASGIWPGSVPQGHEGFVLVALAGAMLLACGLLAGPLPMALRRRAADRTARPAARRSRIHQPVQRKEP